MPISAAARRLPARATRRTFVARVVGRTTVSRNTVRITLAAAELATLYPVGADEFFGLGLPQPGTPLPAPPAGEDLRAAVAALPQAVRPDVRWYTVRAHRPETGEVDVDMVLHGATGPASRWAASCVAGAQVWFREAGAGHVGPDPGQVQVAVADETALPALAVILEQHQRRQDGGTLLAMAEVPHTADVPADTPTAQLQVLPRGAAEPGSVVLPRLRTVLDTVRPDSAWICGESSLATEGRRALVAAGVAKEDITFSGYWKLGAARL